MAMLRIILLTFILCTCVVEGPPPHTSVKSKVVNFLKLAPWKHLHTSFKIKQPLLIDVLSKYRYPDIKYRKFKDCADILKKKNKKLKDGVYKIYPSKQSRGVKVYCDMTTDGGGWTIIQRRIDGTTNFYRKWIDYKNGFGDHNKEYWLGNDIIYLLTKKGDQELRVDLERFSGKKAYAKYSRFWIEDESLKYQLHVTGYSGTAGDALKLHNGKFFTTKDSDNDTSKKANCASRCTGAWWYESCFHANLNGYYYNTKGVHDYRGISWRQFGNTHSVLKSAKMMIRPKV